MDLLAVLLMRKGEEGKGDIPRALELLERAHESGHVDATFSLAQCPTDTHEGPPIGFKRGIRLYEEQILKYDDMASMVSLADALRRGDHGITKDIPRAIMLYECYIAQGLRDDKEELSKLGIESQGSHFFAQCPSILLQGCDGTI